MKNKLIAFTLLIATVLTLSSCFASRSKYGCPGNPTSYNGKYRG